MVTRPVWGPHSESEPLKERDLVLRETGTTGSGEAIPTRVSGINDSLDIVPAPAEHADGIPPAHSLGSDLVVPEAAIEQLEKDGVVCLRNVVDADTVAALRAEADQAVANPGPDARFVNADDDAGIFYYEYNLWRRLAVQQTFVFESHLADVAAAFMRSKSITLYYTNTFVKDGGTDQKATPWHEDGSYSRFVGNNVINVNISYDAMPAETTLKFLQGSHRRPDKPYAALTFVPGVEFDESAPEQVPMPTREALEQRFRTVYWPVLPGDALIFYQNTLHAGPGNSLPTRRHSSSYNLGGDGVTYDARNVFIDSPDVDPDIAHGEPPAGKVFPKLR